MTPLHVPSVTSSNTFIRNAYMLQHIIQILPLCSWCHTHLNHRFQKPCRSVRQPVLSLKKKKPASSEAARDGFRGLVFHHTDTHIDIQVFYLALTLSLHNKQCSIIVVFHSTDTHIYVFPVGIVLSIVHNKKSHKLI